MCNFAKPVFDKELLLCTRTDRHFRLLPSGLMSRLAPSYCRGFLSRYGLLLCVVVCLLWFGTASPAWATNPVTFDGVASILSLGSISLNGPSAVAVDTSGNAYITDTYHDRIVKLDPQGVATILTISGLSPALNFPMGIAVDGAGTLYIADSGNNRIVKVSPSGSGSVLSTGSYTLSFPQGIAVDASGNVFIADTGNNRIVEVPAVGAPSVLTITGLGATPLNNPCGLAVDASGNLYIADYMNARIVKVAAGTTTGSVLPISGLSPPLAGPIAVAVDGLGNIYIADAWQRTVQVTPGGTGGVLNTGTLGYPYGLAVDVFGTVYVADFSNNRIVTVAPSAVGFGHAQLGTSTGITQTLPFTVGGSTTLGAVQAFTLGTPSLDFTVVGSGTTCTSGTTNTTCAVNVQFLPTAPGLRRGAVVLYDNADPPSPVLTIPLNGFADAPVAALAPNTASVVNTGGLTTSFPFQLALDGAGNIYVADYDGLNVTKVAAGGGSASVVSTGSESLGNVTGVALDGAGNLFIADHIHSRIVVVTPGGVASELTIKGLPTTPASGKVLYEPTGIAFDGAGNLYISDWQNSRIVEVSSLVVTASTSSGNGTVIGTGSYSIGSNGDTGVAVDQKGTVYIADRTNNRVIQVTAAGAASLLTPTGITFNDPQGVGVDGMGNIYVADSGNNRIVEITTAGNASVLSINGLPSPNTILSAPFGVTVDPTGNVYIPDWNNDRIVFVNVAAASLTFASTNVGLTSTDSPRTATVTNLGNQALAFSANPSYTADFSENTGDTNLCTSSTSLSAGTLCDVSVEFTPQSGVSLSAGITVTNNSLNLSSNTQQVSVSGTGINSGDTSSTAVAVNPTSLTNGQTAIITATVSDTTSGHASTVVTGPVTFTDNVGGTITSLNGGNGVSLSAGHASLTGALLSGIGTHTITAVYGGVSETFLTSTGTTTVALSKASVTVASPVTQPVLVTFGQTGSAVVTVAGPYATIAVPSGTLSYSILNASSISVASGAPTLTAGATSSAATVPIPNTLVTGSYTVSVTYGGDSNYLASSTATTIQLQISQIIPTINWSPPSAITYGAMLSGILNASALNGGSTVAGGFAYTATPSGGSASTVTSATVLAAGSYTLAAAFTPSDPTTYTSPSANVSLTVNKATPTVSLVPSANPAPALGAVTFTATVSSAAGTPSGSVSFNDGQTLLGSGTLVAGVATYTSSSLTVATHSITAAYGGDANFSSLTSAATLEQINQIIPTINWSPPSAITYGATLSGILNASALNGGSGVAGSFAYTATPSGGSASTVTSATVLAAGSYTLAATFTPTDPTTYTSPSANVSLTVNKATPTVSLVSSLNPVLKTNAVAFTATVSSAVGTPSGSVSFNDGQTLLGSGTLAAGVATYTSSSLAVGAHSITAVYSGDANFASVPSSAVAQTVEDFTLSISTSSGGSTSATAAPGSSASYVFQVGPSSGSTFPSIVAFTVSGLPAGATATLTPQTLPAGSASTTVTLVIQLANQILAHHHANPLGRGLVLAMMGGMFLLPFGRKMRRSAGRAGQFGCLLLLLLAATCATLGLTACGGGGSGYFDQPVQNYTVTVTATSGSLSHNTTVNLTVK